MEEVECSECGADLTTAQLECTSCGVEIEWDDESDITQPKISDSPTGGWPCPKCKARVIPHPEVSEVDCPACSTHFYFIACPKCAKVYSAPRDMKIAKCQSCSTQFGVKDAISPAGVPSTNGGLGRSLLDKAHPRLKKSLLDTLSESEPIEFALYAGGFTKANQMLVATPTRIIIGKIGPTAGVTLGALVTSYNYESIVSIETRTGPVNGWLEILSAANQATLNPHFWSNSELNDPFKRPNCLPAPNKSLKTFAPYIKRIRERVDAAKKIQPSTTQAIQSGDVAEQIKKLSDLKVAGVLSDQEFAQAKSRLLDSL